MITPYHILLSPKARNQILALATKEQKLVIKLIEALAFNPRPPGVKKIEGMIGLHSEDVNGLRIIYKIEDQGLLVLLVKVEIPSQLNP